MTFWIFWAIDVLIALIAIIFFFIGLADGTVSSFNMTLWLTLLLALGVILGASYLLRRSGRNGLATVLSGVLAVPGILTGLLFLAILILQPRWN